MYKYSQVKQLHTYAIDKGMVQKIEDYIGKKVPRLLNIDKCLTNSITITIDSPPSTTIYKTISDFNYEYFDNSIKSLSVELVYENRLNYVNYKFIVIVISFTGKSESSKLAIALLDESPEEKVYAIEKGLLSAIEHSKNINRAIYPNEIVWTLMFMLGVLSLVFGFYTQNLMIRQFCIIFFVVDALYLVVFKYVQGYCLFHSKRQNRIDKALKWLVGTVIGFILVSSLTSVRKEIFGF